jgi:hypothetical protein
MPQQGHQDGQVHSKPEMGIGTTFDDLAKGLASGTLSRGKVLRWMGGALVGAALASVPGVAWANDRCPEGQTRCGDRCVNLQTNERHCGSCANRCRSTQTCCKGRCVNLQGNERHCGSCFNRCPEGSECVGGVCQAGGGCPSGTTLCGGNCVSTDCPSSGQTLNPSTCKCECSANQFCCNGACRDLVCGPNEGFLNQGTCQCTLCPVSTQVVCNGRCVNNVCDTDQVFNYTTCQCETVTCVQCGTNSQDCAPGGAARCGTSSSIGGRCDCLKNIEGGCSCIDFGSGGFCVELEFCTRPTDCPAGKSCVITGCNPTTCEGVCLDRCPNPGC